MINTAYKPEPGEIILCDPNYSPEDLQLKKEPQCTVRANVLHIHKFTVHVEIIDERKTNGKRDFGNTDQFGGTAAVLIQAIQKI